jgi:hypothetical protein
MKENKYYFVIPLGHPLACVKQLKAFIGNKVPRVSLPQFM